MLQMLFKGMLITGRAIKAGGHGVLAGIEIRVFPSWNILIKQIDSVTVLLRRDMVTRIWRLSYSSPMNNYNSPNFTSLQTGRKINQRREYLNEHNINPELPSKYTCSYWSRLRDNLDRLENNMQTLAKKRWRAEYHCATTVSKILIHQVYQSPWWQHVSHGNKEATSWQTWPIKGDNINKAHQRLTQIIQKTSQSVFRRTRHCH